mmetsp:Transcript_38668/g.87075  ORF Transcript_38668/g.87075 Transcript_38668/m.87075 type:complete len:225 (-) Transcript_38668:573-1247(-)
MGFQVGQLPEDDRGADPLVCHPQLDPHPPVSLRDGCHDPAPDVTPRHRSVQRGGHCRGGQRGDWLEACPWRRVPEAGVLDPVVRLRGVWDAGPGNVRGDAHHRRPGLPLAGSQRWPAAVHDAALHPHGRARGLLRCTALQGLRGRRGQVEADHHHDRVPLPRGILLHLLHPEPADLGTEVLGSSALHHAVHDPRAVVWRLRASGVFWRLRRLPKTGYGAARAHE